MRIGFAPDGAYFVFDAETSATLVKGLKTKSAAQKWVEREGEQRAARAVSPTGKPGSQGA